MDAVVGELVNSLKEQCSGLVVQFSGLATGLGVLELLELIASISSFAELLKITGLPAALLSLQR